MIDVSRYCTSCSIILSLASPTGAYAQGLLPDTVSVWANVYIPNDTDNRFISDHPSGKTVVADPFRVYCYATDERSSSDDPEASSRVHARVAFQLSSEEPWIEETDKVTKIGETHEFGCATTEITCGETGTFDEDEIELSRDGNLIRVWFDLASGNPCNFFAENFGAIDFEVVLTIDLLKREFAYEGRIAEFPNYELYLQYDDNEPIAVIDYRLSEDSSPVTLLGEASKIVSGSGEID